MAVQPRCKVDKNIYTMYSTNSRNNSKYLNNREYDDDIVCIQENKTIKDKGALSITDFLIQLNNDLNSKGTNNSDEQLKKNFIKSINSTFTKGLALKYKHYSDSDKLIKVPIFNKDPEISEIYKCDICHKAFNKKRSLASHKKIHKKLKCPICLKTFTIKAALDYHKKLHEDDITSNANTRDISRENDNGILYNSLYNSILKESNAVPSSKENYSMNYKNRYHGPNESQLKDPLLTIPNNNDTKFECFICYRKFNKIGALAIHQKLNHNTTLKWSKVDANDLSQIDEGIENSLVNNQNHSLGYTLEKSHSNAIHQKLNHKATLKWGKVDSNDQKQTSTYDQIYDKSDVHMNEVRIFTENMTNIRNSYQSNNDHNNKFLSSNGFYKCMRCNEDFDMPWKLNVHLKSHKHINQDSLLSTKRTTKDVMIDTIELQEKENLRKTTIVPINFTDSIFETIGEKTVTNLIDIDKGENNAKSEDIMKHLQESSGNLIYSKYGNAVTISKNKPKENNCDEYFQINSIETQNKCRTNLKPNISNDIFLRKNNSEKNISKTICQKYRKMRLKNKNYNSRVKKLNFSNKYCPESKEESTLNEKSTLQNELRSTVNNTYTRRKLKPKPEKYVPEYNSNVIALDDTSLLGHVEENRPAEENGPAEENPSSSADLFYCIAAETTPKDFLLMRNGLENQPENNEWKMLEEYIEEVHIDDSCMKSNHMYDIVHPCADTESNHLLTEHIESEFITRKNTLSDTNIPQKYDSFINQYDNFLAQYETEKTNEIKVGKKCTEGINMRIRDTEELESMSGSFLAYRCN